MNKEHPPTFFLGLKGHFQCVWMDADELIFSINCYISGIIAAILAMTLIMAIVFRTPHEMKNYRVFLLNVSVTDFLLSISMTLLQPVPASSKKEVGTYSEKRK